MASYLFYDIETTGLNYAFDQVLQFAGIRTDADFNEQERYEIYVKLRPDVVPSPPAMIAHCMSIDHLMQKGTIEYDAIRRIHGLMNAPGTISLGYNTLGFDDEFLRFSFYRNLLTPYTHQYANDCGRMDLLPMVIMYWLFRNDTLVWPQIDQKVTMKLEHLKEANQLADGSSHDALVDVEASVALARKMAEDREMWQYLSGYFRKGGDRIRSKKLPVFSDSLSPDYKFGLFINIDYGAERNYLVPVLFLGYSEHYVNQSLWLRLDRPDLPETTLDNIAEKTWVIRKKYGEPGIVLPPYERFLERVDPERMENLDNNKKWLRAHPELLQAIERFYASFKYPQIAEVDADAALYQIDFLTDDEQRECGRFHAATVPEKVEMAGRFQRPELRELAKRILFRNFPEALSPELDKERAAFLYGVNPVFKEEALLDYRGRKRRIPAEAMDEIYELRQERQLHKKQKSVLTELEKYLVTQFHLARRRT